MRRLVITLSLFVVVGTTVSLGAPQARLSGTYYGYDTLPNLSPEEDPYAYWFYAVKLVVNGTSVRVTKRPRYLSKEEVLTSASDGGFPVLEGTVGQVGSRTIIALRQISCDYCESPPNDPLSPEREREYVLLFASPNEFEFDRMRFRRTEDPRLSVVGAPKTSLERTRER